MIVAIAYYMNAGQSIGYPSPLIPAPVSDDTDTTHEITKITPDEPQQAPSSTGELEIIRDDLEMVSEDFSDINSIIDDENAANFDNILDEF